MIEDEESNQDTRMFRVQYQRIETYLVDIDAESEEEAIRLVKNGDNPGSHESTHYDYYEIVK